jgi:formylglycine-generating enzyme required for sulfatase activity
MPALKQALRKASKLSLKIASAFFAVFFMFGIAALEADEAENSIGMRFVLVPAGSFFMGSDPALDPFADADEEGRREVFVTKPFYIGIHEVTQRQWDALMPDNPSKFKGPGNPVENVSYADALSFIEKLNQKEGTQKYRLPTEAEWAYAARAGSLTVWHFGDTPGAISRYAWHSGNSEGKTRPAGLKAPNAWGLYDVHGNVWEWVSDYYGEDYYKTGPNRDPQGPPEGSGRVIRGGGFDKGHEFLRLENRTMEPPDFKNGSLGFRVAFSTQKKKLRLFGASERRAERAKD